jgi:ribosome maturation protein SDO1
MRSGFDREKVHFNLAKIKKGEDVFEIDVDPNLALAFKTGKGEIDDVLKVQHIFTDVRKGTLASEHKMQQYFGTTDVLEVAKIIIMEGDLPLTTEYKSGLRDQKKKQIIDMIRKNAVDSRTQLPIPADRLSSAMDEAKVKIDEFMPVQQQMQEILKKIRPILPIKFEIKELAIHIPAAHAAQSYGIVHQFGKILKDEWQSDGSWVVDVEIPGGLEEDLYEKLNALCHGEVESKVLKVR